MKSEQRFEIRRQIRKGAVTGVDKRAGCGPADSDAVEDGASVRGFGHPPRIGNPVGQSDQRRAPASRTGTEITAVRTDIPSWSWRSVLIRRPG